MVQDKKLVQIIVNGVPHSWPKDAISHAEVVTLDVQSPSIELTYSITYERGNGNKPEGVLVPGASVKVKAGMVFHVSKTGQS
jgi:hypothetical protein